LRPLIFAICSRSRLAHCGENDPARLKAARDTARHRAIPVLARNMHCNPVALCGARVVATDGTQIVVIAKMIERYVREHPRAADTAEGIGRWWLTRQRYEESLELVQSAIDFLVESGRLTRIQLVDGTIVYAAPASAQGEQ
jgi:hypothetical protein